MTNYLNIQIHFFFEEMIKYYFIWGRHLSSDWGCGCVCTCWCVYDKVNVCEWSDLFVCVFWKSLWLNVYIRTACLPMCVCVHVSECVHICVGQRFWKLARVCESIPEQSHTWCTLQTWAGWDGSPGICGECISSWRQAQLPIRPSPECWFCCCPGQQGSLQFWRKTTEDF